MRRTFAEAASYTNKSYPARWFEKSFKEAKKEWRMLASKHSGAISDGSKTVGKLGIYMDISGAEAEKSIARAKSCFVCWSSAARSVSYVATRGESFTQSEMGRDDGTRSRQRARMRMDGANSSG